MGKDVVADVRWFDRDDVEKFLKESSSSSISRKLRAPDQKSQQVADPAEVTVYVPGKYAIAHHLLREFVRRVDERNTIDASKTSIINQPAFVIGLSTLIISSILSFITRGKFRSWK